MSAVAGSLHWVRKRGGPIHGTGGVDLSVSHSVRAGRPGCIMRP
jgi:hypothetical protein